jgi:hypothetical protein
MGLKQHNNKKQKRSGVVIDSCWRFMIPRTMYWISMTWFSAIPQTFSPLVGFP